MDQLCRQCNQVKPEDQFRWLRRVCRECANANQLSDYHANRNERMASARARWKAKMHDRIRLILEAKSGACADCGGRFHPAAMDFDHIGDDKSNEVSTLLRTGASLERIRDEIAKCELVCANCHRVRTHLRLGDPSERPYSIYDSRTQSLLEKE